MGVGLDKLEPPAIIKELVKNLKVLAPDLDEETLLGLVLVNLSYALCAMRVQFREKENGLPNFPNLFVSIFLHSGMGKDTVSKILKKTVFKEVAKFINENEEFYQGILPQLIESNVKKQHEDWTFEDIKKEVAKRLKKQRPFALNCNSSGTEEGLYAECLEYSKRHTGAIFVQQSEAGLFANSKKENKQSYLERLFSGYDNRIEGRNLKEETYATVEDIPIVCEFLSSPDIIKESAKFKQRQTTGFARRFWIFMQTEWKKTLNIATEEEENRAFQNLYDIGKNLFFYDIESDEKPIFAKVMDANRNPSDPNKEIKNAVLPFEKGLYDNYFIPYKKETIKLQNTIEDKQIRDSISEHPFRACKVACIYAILNHPDKLIITKDDFIQATRTVDNTDRIHTLFNYAPKEKDEFDYISEALIKEFTENKPEDGIFNSKVLYDLIDNAIRPVVLHHRRQTVRQLIAGDNLENTRNTLAENLQTMGYDLQPVIGKGNFKGFKMVKLEEVKTPEKTEEETTAGLY